MFLNGINSIDEVRNLLFLMFDIRNESQFIFSFYIPIEIIDFFKNDISILRSNISPAKNTI